MRTSRLLLLSVNALAILLADALSASQSRTDLKRFGEPQSRKVVGYEEASCLDVTSEIQVCKADSSPEPNDLLLLARGELVRKWGDRSGMHRGMILDVFLADLDADSRPELVIADRLAASNGMAMTRDEVFIVSRFESLDRSVVRFTAAEYHGGMFVRRAGRSGRWILATDWEGSSVLDPRRGRGTYLVGRWFRFANGRLVREPGVLVRRLLDSFALERAGMGPTAPYGWFLNGKGRSVEIDPALGDGTVRRTTPGVVQQVEDADSAEAVYRIRFDTGEALEMATIFTSAAHPARVRLTHAGLASSGQVLPAGVPLFAVLGDITGRRARLAEYRDGDNTNRVLWVE